MVTRQSLRAPRKWLRRAMVGVLVVGGPVALGVASAASTCQASTLTASPTCTLQGQATVSGGTLSVQAPGTIKWSSTLNGFDRSIDAQVTYTIVDATGSGSGWNLTASATPFVDATGTSKCSAAAPCRMHRPITLNASATTAQGTTAPKPFCATGSTCKLPTYTKVSFPVSIPLTCASTGTLCAPSTLVTAGHTSGMGAISCTTDWWLSVPANAFAGAYTNTITLTVSSGP